MSDVVKIILSALGIFALVFVFWFIRVKMDARKLSKKLHQRRVEDEERERLMAERADWLKPFPKALQNFPDDDTKTLP